MLVWRRILDTVRNSTPLAYVLQARDPRDSITFTIAMIALSAKLAKADGHVVVSEIAAFRDIFTVEPEQQDAVARIYDLCRQDPAGYREYAIQVVGLFGKGARILEDIMDALFHVALADGGYTEEEDVFLDEVGTIFGLTPRCMARLKARHVPDHWDPWSVLGVADNAGPYEIRRRYHELVRRSHPDVLRANGLPEEMMELANRRLADINRAYTELSEAPD